MKPMVKSSALAVILGVVATPTIAHAQAEPAPRDPNSTVAVELRFGPYRPRVDEGVPRGAPYQTAFGDGTRYMIGAEIDWQPLHVKHVGSLGIGGMFGYTRAKANAKFSDGSGDSAEDTTFSLWVLSPLLVARIDVLARETWVPLVPYAKIGPGIGLWTASNGSGTATVDGVLGKGRTLGFVYGVGLMFMLDAIDRQAAKTFSAEQGVHHTYFFGEYTAAELNQSNAMRVGDRTWTLGLTMEL